MKTNSLWFKDAIIYEVSVRAFFDSNDDGIGDFRGFTGKLDYLQDLGITAVWILPFFPSPLKDDGYDISDYSQVSSIYGTLDDFKAFLDAAHQRGIRVIIELILNHTSDQHPWFQRARRASKGSADRDFYVWSDTADKYPEARIIFQDFEGSNWSWDSVANAYYWHRFYSHQPDLNYDNPAVRHAVLEVLDFWLDMGVDGLRLDAVPYLYERDGTNCENLRETHQFLKQIRQHIDERFPARMLLAEANQWSEDAVEYFGNGDECHMNFHFPLMPRLFMSLRMEDSFPIVDILQQTPAIPDTCQWALFLRNHDELTLEMVTDEDRDFMYQVYAQDPEMRHNLGIRRRLAPLLGNDRRQIELLNSLLLSLPGTPVLYYGDEIGMGDNIYVGDRNGVRTPMQWSADLNAGFSRANSQQLYLPVIVDSEYHYAVVNVETQRANLNSLWFAIRRLIAVRKRYKALGKGTCEFFHPANRKVMAFTRTDGDEQILVVANLSRFVQTVELDLSKFRGRVPIEVFGQTEFPKISDEPYFLSLSPYACYWFNLKPDLIPPQPLLTLAQPWKLLSQPDLKLALETILASYLTTCSWCNGRDRRIQSAQIIEAIPVIYRELDAQIIWLQVDYLQGNSETYLLFLTQADAGQASSKIVARLQIQGKDTIAVLLEVTADEKFLHLLTHAVMETDQTYSGIAGEVGFTLTGIRSAINPGDNETGTVDDRSLMLKLFHTVEEGIHPEVEMRRFLSEKTDQVVPLVGVLEYRRPLRNPMTIATLQSQIQSAQSVWDYTLDSLRGFFEQVTSLADSTIAVPPEGEFSIIEISPLAMQTIGSYLVNMQRLGQTTAELHCALASDSDNPNFAPEPFSSLYQRSLYQQSRNLTGRVFILLKERLNTLPPSVQPMAKAVLDRHEEFLERFRSIIAPKITAQRIRCHGNYQLRQLLYTGEDFRVVNFEGEPGRSLSERRIERSPLRDVASLLLSFHDASRVALMGIIQAERLPSMEQWAQFWESWVSAAFLNGYLAIAQPTHFLPQTQTDLSILLNAYLLEKAIVNLGSELVDAPDRAQIWLRRLLQF